MQRMINPVMQTVRPVSSEQVKSYLCGSVPVQKLLAEPGSLAPGGCSQCGSAMSRSEGASQQYSGGWRFGLVDARVPALTAKRNCCSFSAVPCVLIRLPRWAFRVLRVATWRKRSIIRTIEDPRRSRFGGTTGCYKALPKCVLYAAVHGTGSLRPVVRGCQLGQSSCPQGQSKAGPQKLRFGVAASEKLALRFKPQSARDVPLHVQTRSHAKQHSVTAAKSQRSRSMQTQTHRRL